MLELGSLIEHLRDSIVFTPITLALSTVLLNYPKVFEKQDRFMVDLITDKGFRLSTYSEEHKLLLVFLRHFGCTFCRETLADIQERKETLEKKGVKIVFVHMMPEAYAEEIFKIYDLDGIDHISDPMKKLYNHFGLETGSFNQVLGFKVWLRFVVSGLFKGHLVGPAKGDAWQMPGVFLYHKNKVLRAYRHKQASDRPNYLELACEMPIAGEA